MNRQLPRRSILHPLFSALTRKAPRQAKQPVQPPQRPAPDDREAWPAYWKAQGQPWRTEPEIDEKRQAELAQRRAIVPQIEKGNYPFKGAKLSRADVEWLLATHKSGGMVGPVDWNDEKQRNRVGLDVRGADLCQVDLSHLPLAGLCGGEHTRYEWLPVTYESRNVAGVHMEGAHLFEAHLEGANLIHAHLEQANLNHAYLEEADLRLIHLEEALLRGTYLAGANLYQAHLEAAKLGGCYLSTRTKLREIILGNEQLGFAFLTNIHWGNADLSVVDWAQMPALGNDYQAHQPRKKNGERKDTTTRHYEFRVSTRASRQLAVVLQAQGLNEDAARFVYRAQVLQRHVFWFQMLQRDVKPKQRMRALGAWLFSWFLNLVAGYGYKLWRSFLAYLLVIGIFMALYLLLNPHLAWYEAIVVSMTAFHGRGFSPSTFSPGDPLSIASAVEAFVGLVIEVIFIATLTRRFFGQ